MYLDKCKQVLEHELERYHPNSTGEAPSIPPHGHFCALTSTQAEYMMSRLLTVEQELLIENQLKSG